MEAIVGAQILTDADCASAFGERFTIIIMLAAAAAVMVLFHAVKRLLVSPDGWREIIFFSAGKLAFFWGIAALLYVGTLASEGRRQTLSEEGVRGLSLRGNDLIARYCHARSAKEVSIPLSQVSDWSVYVQEPGSKQTAHLRFRWTHPDDRVEWPRYISGLGALGGAASGVLARIAPEAAAEIRQAIATYPPREWR